MPVEVVSQHPCKLFRSLDVGASGDQMTTRKTLIKVGVVSPVQLIDHHLPDWVRAGRTVLGVTVALVGHSGKRDGMHNNTLLVIN